MPFMASYIQKVVNSLPEIIDNFSEDVDTTNNIIHKYKMRVYVGWAAYVLPVFFAIVGLKSIISLGIPWHGRAATVYEVLVGMCLLIVGSIGWHFLSFLLLLRAIGQIEIVGEPFYWPNKYFGILNQKSLEIFGLGVILYVGAILTVWLIPWGTLLLLNGSFSYYWIFPLAAIVISYFILEQYYVHSIIKCSKEKRLEKIDKLLEHAFYESMGKGGSKNMIDINHLITWRNIVNAEIDWPINMGSNVAIVGAILAPAVATFIEFVLR